MRWPGLDGTISCFFLTERREGLGVRVTGRVLLS